MEVRDEYVADVSRYSGPLREAAREADKFSRNNEQAALAARKMGLASKEAADKAAQAQKAAADAAEKLARGELKADEAAQLEAKALREVERAAIKAAEAELAAGRAADSAAKNMKQMGRDASLAAAATHLAALREVGDATSYNEALTRLKKTHGDLSKTALASFKAMENNGNGAYKALTAAGEVFAKAGPLKIVPVANAIANLPAIASVAAGGVSLALGGALSGVGLMAQARSKDIQRTFAAMSKQVSRDLTEISTPFHDTLLHISADAGHAFKQLEPALEGAFAEMAPAVTRFSSNLASGLSGPRVQSAIESIGHSFTAVLDDLGPATESAIGDVADGIKSISDAAASNPQALSSLVTGVGQLTKYTAEGVGALIKYKTEVDGVVHAVAGMGPGGLIKFVGTLKDGTDALMGTSHGLQIAGGSFPTFEQKAVAAAAATGHLMTAQQAAALSSEQLKVSIDHLTSGFASGFDATTQYRQALVAANAQAHSNNAGIDGMSKAALANRQSLSTMAGAIRNVMETSHPTSAAIEKMRGRFISAAVGMGTSRAAAERLADKLLGVRDSVNKIPRSHTTKVTANTSGAMSALDRFLATVNRIPTHRQLMIDVRYNGVRPDLAATGGQYMGPGKGFKYAGGGEVSGLISGPGTGTSDSIPAPWLSNGEFVVNSKTTDANTAALMNLNAGMSWMRAGLLGGERFAKGGKVKAPTAAQKKAGAARVALARSRPEYLAAMAAQKALESMRKNIYGGFFQGGPSTPGSAHGSVVQHTTTVNVTVQGSVTTANKLASDLQSIILRNNMPLSLPRGR